MDRRGRAHDARRARRARCPAPTTRSRPIPATCSASAPSGLTITFGFGPGLFTRDGKDRYGLAAAPPCRARRSAALQRRPADPEKTGGDLYDPGLRERCASRLPCRAATGAPGLRHRGDALGPGRFPVGSARSDAAQPDGLQGRHQQPVDRGASNDEGVRLGERRRCAVDARRHVHASCGSIRITLEHWDKMELGFQEQVFGRHKYSGAPIGKKKRIRRRSIWMSQDKDGNPVIPENSHVRLSNQAIEQRRADSAPLVFVQRRHELLHRALAAMAAGNGIQRGADFHRASERPAQRLHSDQRKAREVRHDEPVHDACRQRGVCVPAGREAGFVHRRGAVRNVSAQGTATSTRSNCITRRLQRDPRDECT